jgi:hypothetical protein
MEPAEVMAAASLLLHIVVLLTQYKTKADMAELKLWSSEHFATKDDFKLILRKALKEQSQ